jgi:transposase
LASISNESKENLVYLDESGIDTYINNPWVYSARGKQVYGEVSGKRYDRESFIAAKVGSKIIAPMCFKGTCNTEVFNTWLEKVLIPELRLGQIIIMDNAAFHKSQKTKELLENAGCRVLFLPPYSPDFNPIEKFWANLKAKIKSSLINFNSLSEAIDYAFSH